MFSIAYDIASKFTQPVIISLRHFDKTVDCMLGSFVILNDEGWIVTVSHLLEPQVQYNQHLIELNNYKSQIDKINADSSLTPKHKQKKISHLTTNPKWITNLSYWWGRDGIKISQLQVLAEGDLAIGRIDTFDPVSVSSYPRIKNPNNLRYGSSLCKLGFPFHEPKAQFDDASGIFTLSPGTLPIPRFPIEGIFTRDVYGGKSKDGKYDIRFIETSTPGLRGQSGGPIFDVKGVIWGIQSRTMHLPLGFSPKIMKNGREIEENQFLNVGLGVHPALLISFLNDNGVKIQVVD